MPKIVQPVGSRQTRNPSSPHPWALLPESSELCLMTVTIKDFLSQKGERRQFDAAWTQSQSLPFPQTEKRKKKKKIPADEAERLIVCISKPFEDWCPQTNSERGQHS